jgi:hypothetical protein
MASGRVEIAYTGIQDTFLTGDPQFTYFQKVYKQHTKFALEVMDTPIDGALGFGQNLVATIPRMGDLIRTIYLRVLLSNVSSSNAVVDGSNVGYTDSIGNALIDYADLIIGGQTVQRINGEFMEIYSDMWISDSQQASMKALVGTNYDLNALTGIQNASLYIIPLPFYFYRNDSMAIPLSAITFQEVQVRIQLKPLSQLVVPAMYAPGNYPGDAIASILQMSVPVEFIFLSTPELNYIKRRQIDYAITQLQQNKQTIPAGETFTQMQLTFVNPVRELYIVIQTSNAVANNDLFSYSNIYNGTPVDILQSINLKFNNETRINSDIANYLYLRKAQPLNFHTRSPTRFIYSYSFSLFPENSEPSGQTNMSRIINKLLNVNINSQEYNVEVRVYARSFNILRIRNGLAGVIFIDNNFF